MSELDPLIAVAKVLAAEPSGGGVSIPTWSLWSLLVLLVGTGGTTVYGLVKLFTDRRLTRATADRTQHEGGAAQAQAVSDIVTAAAALVNPYNTSLEMANEGLKSANRRLIAANRRVEAVENELDQAKDQAKELSSQLTEANGRLDAANRRIGALELRVTSLSDQLERYEQLYGPLPN